MTVSSFNSAIAYAITSQSLTKSTVKSYVDQFSNFDISAPDALTKYTALVADYNESLAAAEKVSSEKVTAAKIEFAALNPSEQADAQQSMNDLTTQENLTIEYKDALSKNEASTINAINAIGSTSTGTPGPVTSANPNVATPIASTSKSVSTPSSTGGLSSFISQIKNTGIPLSSKFLVTLPALPGFLNSDELSVLCNSATLPTHSIGTVPLKIYGESIPIPGTVDYGQFQLTFLVTNKFNVQKYFEQWMNGIFDRSSRSFGFYNDYAKSIQVSVLDKSGTPRYTTIYNQCFPVGFSSSGLSYDNNHPITFTVGFAFKYWDIAYGNENGLNQLQADALQSNSLSALRAFDNNTLTQAAGLNLAPYNGNGILAGSALGPIMGSSALLAANQAAQGVSSLKSLSDGTPVGSLMSKYMNQLGTSSSIIGAGIGSIGGNLGTILAPMGTIANGVSSMGNVLKATDNLLSRMGIKTNIGSVVNNMNGVAGVIAITGQLNGIPGALSSLGSVMGSVGGEITQIQRSLVNVPGATSQMGNTLTNLGNVTTTNANTISGMSSMNFRG